MPSPEVTRTEQKFFHHFKKGGSANSPNLLADAALNKRLHGGLPGILSNLDFPVGPIIFHLSFHTAPFHTEQVEEGTGAGAAHGDGRRLLSIAVGCLEGKPWDHGTLLSSPSSANEYLTTAYRTGKAAPTPTLGSSY